MCIRDRIDALSFEGEVAPDFVENIVIAVFFQTHVGGVGKAVKLKRELPVSEG